jgi:hypothetical protein
VLDGDIDALIWSGLQWQAEQHAGNWQVNLDQNK